MRLQWMVGDEAMSKDALETVSLEKSWSISCSGPCLSNTKWSIKDFPAQRCSPFKCCTPQRSQHRLDDTYESCRTCPFWDSLGAIQQPFHLQGDPFSFLIARQNNHSTIMMVRFASFQTTRLPFWFWLPRYVHPS